MENFTLRRSDLWNYFSSRGSGFNQIQVECVVPYDELDWVNMGRINEGARFLIEFVFRKVWIFCFFVCLFVKLGAEFDLL